MTVTHFLESNLRENLIVAVGMGRNVAAVAEMQAARSFESLTFVVQPTRSVAMSALKVESPPSSSRE